MTVPTETHFVEHLPELTRAAERRIIAGLCGLLNGGLRVEWPDLSEPPKRFLTRGHRHVWAVCDGCGQGSLVASTNVGHACRMAPANIRSEWRQGERKPREISELRCPGHHWPPGDARATSAPPDGRCRCCRKDPAVFVATHDRTGERWLSCGRCAAQAERYRAPITYRDLRAEEAA